LDVGCGSGHIPFQVSGKGFEVIAVDISRELLQELRDFTIMMGRPNLHLVLASATQLPFRKNTFDSCIYADVIEHIENTNGVLNEAYFVTKVNGHMCVTIPNGWTLS
jgi:ubiquinone/menaquinone biosynthesis C-methylase UbiE